MLVGDKHLYQIVYNPSLKAMEHVVANFLTADITVSVWDKDKKNFSSNVSSEAFCYRNPEYNVECEFYTYIEVPPLGYEILKYSPFTTASETAVDVISDGFDGLYRDELTIFDIEEE